jgi:hypothetical protein
MRRTADKDLHHEILDLCSMLALFHAVLLGVELTISMILLCSAISSVHGVMTLGVFLSPGADVSYRLYHFAIPPLCNPANASAQQAIRLGDWKYMRRDWSSRGLGVESGTRLVGVR